MKKYISLYIIFFCLLILSCKKNPKIGIDCSLSQVGEPPYKDPVWHPSGNIIGFNHTPLKEVIKNGNECPDNFTYIYHADSTGFWLIDANGKNKRRVLPFEIDKPAWSPDGKWISFSRGAQLYKMSFDGKNFDTANIVKLTSEGRNFLPSWSPDGLNIAYRQTVCTDMQCGVWLKNLNNNILEFLVSYGSNATWLNNLEIVYTKNVLSNSGADLGDSIIVLNTINKEKRRIKFLTGANRDNLYLKTSPDGTKIGMLSFSSIVGESIQVYTINVDGSDLKKLTTSGADNFSWSPSAKIAFINFDHKKIDETSGTIWIMDGDGNNKTQLTKNQFNFKPYK